MPSVELPNRSLFKAPEVCEIAQLQPYVLRSWESEFPDLGVTRAGTRVYRRGDVERVLRLKHLLFVEGLTLAGARRRLEEEKVPLPEVDDVSPPDRSARTGARGNGDAALRKHLTDVRQGLQSLLEILERPGGPQSFELKPGPEAERSGRKPAKTVKSKKGRTR